MDTISRQCSLAPRESAAAATKLSYRELPLTNRWQRTEPVTKRQQLPILNGDCRHQNHGAHRLKPVVRALDCHY